MTKQVIEVCGEKYLIKKTFDISDDGKSIESYDIYAENGAFLGDFITDDINELKEHIKNTF